MPAKATTYPLEIPTRLIERLPAPSRDGYVYADVRFRGSWAGILVIDADHRCVGVYVGRGIVEHPLPFVVEEIEDFRPPVLRNRLLAWLPRWADPYSTGALLIVVGCPVGLALGALASRRLALLAPLAAFVGIWLMYQVAGFPFMRLLIAMLGVGGAVAGLMVGLSGLT